MNNRCSLLFGVFLFLFLCTNSANAQFYKGVKEVKAYEDELAKLDEFLQTNPKNLTEVYDNLFDIAEEERNLSLMSVLYIYQGTAYYYIGDSKQSINHFNMAIELADKIDSESLKATARIRKVFVVGEHTYHRAAYQMMKDEFVIARENRDTINMIYSLNGMNLFGEHNTEDSGFGANMEAIRLAELSGNEYEFGFLLNNLGITKLDFEDTEGAKKDFNRALEISERVGNARLELIVRENIGYYYLEVDSTEEAKQTFVDVYNRAKSISHYQAAVTSIVNLSGVYRRLGDYNYSDSLVEVGLDMAKSNDMYHLVSIIYLSKAQNSLYNERYSRVETFIDSASVYEKFSTQTDIQAGIYRMNYEMFQQKKDFKTALEYYQKLKDYEDSINKNGRLQVISELQLKYDVEKKENEKIQQKVEYEEILADKELSTAVLKQRIAIGLVVCVLLIAGVIVYYVRKNHRKEREFSAALVNRLEEERSRIARDLHDGLGQSLIILKNKFNKIENGAADLSGELNANFSETIEEVRSISRSLIPPELRRLGLRKSLNKMLTEVENSSDIVVTSEIEDVDKLSLNESEEIRIYRIVQELLTNTIKHSGASSLKLEFIVGEKGYQIIYQDNGKGLGSVDITKTSNSVGLKSIQQRVKFLNGNIKFEKPVKGFKVIVKIKN